MKVNPLKYPLITTLCMSFPVLMAKVSDIKLCCVNKVLTTPKVGRAAYVSY